MRYTFFRIGNVMAILATVGSFLVELHGAVYFDSPTVTEQRLVAPMPACDWTPYIALLGRFRGTPKAFRPAGQQTIGEDAYFTYRYDHETETGICEPLPNRPVIRVEASRSSLPDQRRQTVILVCVLVIVASATGLKITQMIRSARDKDK